MSDLDTQLAEWARGVVGRPAVVGELDCGTMTRDVLQAQGVPVNVTWSSPMQAGRVLLQHDDGFAGWLRSLGCVAVPPLFARSGDVLVLRRDHAAPVVGPHALLLEPDGVVTPVLVAEAVWTAGEGATAWRVAGE